jgi:hypothetical protein
MSTGTIVCQLLSLDKKNISLKRKNQTFFANFSNNANCLVDNPKVRPIFLSTERTERKRNRRN